MSEPQAATSSAALSAMHADPLVVDDLTGRPCLDVERFAIGTILEVQGTGDVDADTTAVDSGRTVTARYEGSGGGVIVGSLAEHLPLPRRGERVTVTTGTGPDGGVSPGVISGHWVAVHANAADRTLLVGLLTERGMQRLRCGGRDFIVTGTVAGGGVPDAAWAALAEGVQAARSREVWVEQLVADAHVYADRNDLCGVFDEFMEGHGLPGRTRSYTVRVAVASTVLVPVSARSEGEAEDLVDRDEVRAYLDLGTFADRFDWSVEYAEVSD